ncbi:MAG: hypothetical protein HFG66_16015 [Hungatella sp.]|nr:hypothetical protein [Hungatella sp.]
MVKRSIRHRSRVSMTKKKKENIKPENGSRNPALRLQVEERKLIPWFKEGLSESRMPATGGMEPTGIRIL